MNTFLPLILIGVIFFLIGLAVGVLSANLQSSKGEKAEQPQPPVPNAIEVVRLWRDPRKGNLIPEIDGKILTSPDRLGAAQQARLLQADEDLHIWLAGSALPPVVARPAAPAAPVATAAFVASTDPAKRPSMNPIDVLSRAVATDVKPVSTSKSIAAQIDEILQEKLENSPLKNRAIRLLELPGRGMVVMVGLNQYEGVDAVPDPEIRNLLRECVAEWEAR